MSEETTYDKQAAKMELDSFLFRNVHNAWVSNESEWQITFYGDHYLVHNIPHDKWYQFKIVMEDSDFDFSQEILDQEWCEDDRTGDFTVGTYAQPEEIKKTWNKKHALSGSSIND